MLSLFSILAIFCGGVIFGVIAIWWALCRRYQQTAETVQEQLRQKEDELHQCQIDLAVERNQLETLSALDEERAHVIESEQQARQLLASSNQESQSLRRRLDEATDRLKLLEQERQSLTDQLAGYREELARLKEAKFSDEKAAQEKITLLMQAKDSLSVQFQEVATQVLEGRTKRLHEHQNVNLGKLLSPLQTKLEEFQKSIVNSTQETIKERATLAEQVRSLTESNRLVTEETQNLTKALKGDSKTQGALGEMILERLLDVSGLRKGEEYETQVTGAAEDHTGEVNRVRPDVVVYMPEKRQLVIDAKTSLTAFEQYVRAEDEGEKQNLLKLHLQSIKNHMEALSKKNYHRIQGLNTVDYVVMFVPIEAAFLTAIHENPSLYQDAWNKHVLLVSPSTLLFVLRMVDNLWRQENQKDNAQKILDQATKLYDRFRLFDESFEKMGALIAKSQDAYDEARKRLKVGRGNVYGQIDKLAEQRLISPPKRLPEIDAEDSILSLDDAEPPSSAVSS